MKNFLSKLEVCLVKEAHVVLVHSHCSLSVVVSYSIISEGHVCTILHPVVPIPVFC